jgi:DinB superfamily
MSYSVRPVPAEYPTYYHAYVGESEGHDLLGAMHIAGQNMHAALDQLPTDREDHRYAPGKWTIKEVVQHVIDAERIFAYRALRFARKDNSPLPGFSENDYAPASLAGRRPLKDLLHEHDLVRGSSIALFQSFPLEALAYTGTANGLAITVRAIGWVIAGHANHHTRVLAERYRT